jgi:hypothetical protein
MSDLPPGFVMTAPQESSSDLPPGFVMGQPAKKPFGLGDTWPARLAKSIYSAVTLPGDVAQGNVSMTGEDGHSNPEVINRAAELASIASPMSPAARSGVGFAGALKTVDAPAPTREALETAAGSGYDSARGLGVEIHPQGLSDLGGKIGASLNEMGIDGELAPKTFSILKKISNPPEDAVATVSNLETLRRSFGHAAGDFTNPTEQLAASKAKQHLSDYLAAIPDQDVIRGPASEASGLIKDANSNYAAAKRSELIAEQLQKADQNAAAANSGANVGNAERQKLKQVYQNDRKSAGYSDDELAQMDKIIRGTPLANKTRTLGNLLGGGGGLGGAASAAIGGAATAHMGGVGAVAPVVGYGLKKFSDNLGKKEINLLDEMVRRRSALGQSMPDKMAGSVSPERAALARALMLGATPQQ